MIYELINNTGGKHPMIAISKLIKLKTRKIVMLSLFFSIILFIIYYLNYRLKYPELELSQNELFEEYNDRLKDFDISENQLIAMSNDPWIDCIWSGDIPIKVFEIDIVDINSLGGMCEIFNSDTWSSVRSFLKTGKNYIFIHNYLQPLNINNCRIDLVEVEGATVQLNKVIINSRKGIFRLAMLSSILTMVFFVIFCYLIKTLYKSFKAFWNYSYSMFVMRKLVCAVFCFWTAFYLQKYMMLPDNGFLWIVIAILLCFIFNKNLLLNSRLEMAAILFFSVSLSVATISGFHISINGSLYFGFITENFILKYTFDDVIGFFLLTYAFFKIFSYFYKRIISINYKLNITKEYKRGRIEYCIIVAGFIFMSWLPYFLIYYPGFIFPDSLSSIYQALGEPLNNHHPVMYTLFLKLCLNLGILIKDITFGCALYTLAQMIYIAFCLGYMVCWLKNKGISIQKCIVIMVSFAFLPFIAQNSIAMWKDPFFSATILLWSLHLLDYVMSEGRIFLEQKWYVIKSCILIFLICFSRNNGFYLVLFSELIFIGVRVLNKKKDLLVGLKGLCVSTGVALICVYFITNPIYTCLGIKSEPVESLGIFLNQMARVVAYEGKMSEEDYQFMDNLLPIEKYSGTYRPCVVDRLKWDEDFDQEFLNEHLADFIKTYFSLMVKNPKLYIGAWELNTFGYWAPNRWELFSDNSNIEKGDLDSFYTWDHKGINPRNLLENIVDQNDVISYKGTTLYLAEINWLVLLALMLIFIRKRHYIIAVAPSLGLIATLFIATPYAYWQRYGLAEYYLLPIYIFIMYVVLGCEETN